MCFFRKKKRKVDVGEKVGTTRRGVGVLDHPTYPAGFPEFPFSSRQHTQAYDVSLTAGWGFGRTLPLLVEHRSVEYIFSLLVDCIHSCIHSLTTHSFVDKIYLFVETNSLFSQSPQIVICTKRLSTNQNLVGFPVRVRVQGQMVPGVHF